MVANKVHYRHLMLFFFRKNKTATQAANKICAVYGEDAVAERTVQKWFARFKAGNFDLEDQELPAGMLCPSKSTIHDHTVKLGYVSRLDIWVPHDLTEKNLLDRISICDLLYKRNEKKKKRSWRKCDEPPLVTPKAGLHPKKTAIEQKRSEIANWKGVVFHHDNARPHVSLRTQQKLLEFVGMFTPSTVFARPCAVGFPPFPVVTKFL
ncbi:histone-lysine N-methyltransferase SETMAR-like [Polistes fuscatus]|uniref:histone-lysine N-methyltransferase SETMAR-like n=1 Tax=Polistes fuscatus TaxID=30207 RepID=UPI001CA8D916|nr:histone-lysine N-methyltransferase SETMAR-like [Polistes fuscatus]